MRIIYSNKFAHISKFIAKLYEKHISRSDGNDQCLFFHQFSIPQKFLLRQTCLYKSIKKKTFPPPIYFAMFSYIANFLAETFQRSNHFPKLMINAKANWCDYRCRMKDCSVDSRFTFSICDAMRKRVLHEAPSHPISRFSLLIIML